MIYNTLHRKLKIERYKPHQDRGELGCSGRESSFCAPPAPPVVLILLQTNHVISHERMMVNICFCWLSVHDNKYLRNIKYIVLFLDHQA